MEQPQLSLLHLPDEALLVIFRYLSVAADAERGIPTYCGKGHQLSARNYPRSTKDVRSVFSDQSLSLVSLTSTCTRLNTLYRFAVTRLEFTRLYSPNTSYRILDRFPCAHSVAFEFDDCDLTMLTEGLFSERFICDILCARPRLKTLQIDCVSLRFTWLRKMMEVCLSLEEFVLLKCYIFMSKPSGTSVDDERTLSLCRQHATLRHVNFDTVSICQGDLSDTDSRELDIRWLALDRLPNLKKLSLCGRVKGDSFKCLASLSGLESLTVSQIYVPSTFLASHISNLPNLRHLRLAFMNSAEPPLLTICSAMQHLEIESCSFSFRRSDALPSLLPTEVSVESEIHESKSLKKLSIENASFEQFDAQILSDVEELYVKAGGIPWGDFAFGLFCLLLPKCTALIRLALDLRIGKPEPFFFRHISELPNLRVFTFRAPHKHFGPRDDDPHLTVEEAIIILSSGPCRQSLRLLNLRIPFQNSLRLISWRVLDRENAIDYYRQLVSCRFDSCVLDFEWMSSDEMLDTDKAWSSSEDL